MGKSNDERESTMRLRAQVYRMFASLYFTELTEEQVRRFATMDWTLFDDLDDEMATGAHEVARELRHVTSLTREDLAVDYAHIFLAAGSTKDEARAVPFESVFTSETGMLMEQARDDVYHAMRAEGLLPQAELRVPEDHLAFECEFMGALAQRTADALARGDETEARRLVGVQADFRACHLANWVGTFTEAVLACCRTRFYAGIARMTDAFVRVDGELLSSWGAAA